jgi:hypothetical protein
MKARESTMVEGLFQSVLTGERVLPAIPKLSCASAAMLRRDRRRIRHAFFIPGGAIYPLNAN